MEKPITPVAVALFATTTQKRKAQKATVANSATVKYPPVRKNKAGIFKQISVVK